MNNIEEKLVETARSVSRNAYAPYSEFYVGAALLSEDGKIYGGCNVECASYGGTICAERSALLQAIADGRRSFMKIAIFTDTEHPTPPCGHCLQMLHEFAPDIEVLLVTPHGIDKRFSLKELLPHPFGPEDLGKR